MEERLYPYGDLVRSGALVTYGSDIPGVRISEIAPLTQIEAAVTRKRPGFPGDRALVPRQRIDLHDALRGYTINGAYQLRLDDIAGSLEVGKARRPDRARREPVRRSTRRDPLGAGEADHDGRAHHPRHPMKKGAT
jgi:Amidohydrolase family